MFLMLLVLNYAYLEILHNLYCLLDIEIILCEVVGLVLQQQH
jgi:hypothetical protein